MSHGLLWLKDSFVVVHGQIKLIKPVENYNEHNMANDFTYLAQFLHNYLNPHTEWNSFNQALCATGLE